MVEVDDAELAIIVIELLASCMLEHVVVTRPETAAALRRFQDWKQPFAPFVTTLGVPAVGVPTVNPDNNQHAENENIRVGNYVDAVKTFLAILAEPID